MPCIDATCDSTRHAATACASWRSPPWTGDGVSRALAAVCVARFEFRLFLGDEEETPYAISAPLRVVVEGRDLPEALRFAAKQLKEVKLSGSKLDRRDVYRLCGAANSLRSLLQRAAVIHQSESTTNAVWRCMAECLRQAEQLVNAMARAHKREAEAIAEAESREEAEAAAAAASASDGGAVVAGAVAPEPGAEAPALGAGAGAGAGAGTNAPGGEAGGEAADEAPDSATLKGMMEGHDGWRRRERSVFHACVRCVACFVLFCRGRMATHNDRCLRAWLSLSVGVCSGPSWRKC